jgi:DNA-binding SARP family transcriptional activator
MNNTLEIRLFGDFALRQNGRFITDLDSVRLQALLAYLLLHRGVPQLRQHLAFTFWPDSDERQARTNLRNLLHRLRQAWPQADHYLAIETKSLTWRGDVDFWLDVAEFEQQVAQAETAVDPADAQLTLQQAIDLYRHDLLPGCYDDWIIPERTRLRRAFLQAAEQQAGFLQQSGSYQEAIQQYQRLSEAEPLQERYYRRLMQLNSQAGDKAAALRVYYRCVSVLRRELDVTPGEATQTAYRQLLALDTPLTHPLPNTPSATNLVGRSVVWEQLRLTWQAIEAGSQPPRLILLSGEAGIGKTRLAEELTDWARRQEATTAVAACYAAESQLAFGPVVGWLNGFDLTHLAHVWRDELARLLPQLTTPGTPSPALSSGGESWQKGRFYEALAQAVFGQKQPICLRLEDIQWCDTETLAWLSYLLRAGTGHRLLLVATWRQEEMSEPFQEALLRWRQQDYLLEIDLPRLNAAETAELAAALLEQPIPDKLATTLYSQTEGNPLFIVETIRSSLGSQTASGETALNALLDSLTPDSGPTPARLPPKIQAVLRSRLAQLSAETRRLLDVAAVIGRSFTTDILWRASGVSEDEMVTAVDEMWRRQIVRDREAGEYDFSHNKLRQVAYDTLSPARRRWLHGRVAQALTASNEAGPVYPAGRIAFHHEAAGQATQAFNYHRQAAGTAWQVYAFGEAVFHLRQAIALLDRVPLAEAEQAGLHEQLGDMQTLAGRHDEAREAFETAVSLTPFPHRLDRARLGYKQADTWLAHYELEIAWQQYEAALGLLPPPADLTDAEMEVWLDIRLKQLDVLYFNASLTGMADLIEATRPWLTGHGTRLQQARFFQLLAQLHSRQTRFRHTAEGVNHARKAVALAQETTDKTFQQGSRFGLGFMLLWQAEPDIPAAIAELEAVVHSSQTAGNIPLLDRCLAYLAVAYRLSNRQQAVAELLPQCDAVARQEENALYLSVAQANEAWLAYRDGDNQRVRTLCQHAQSRWYKLSFPFHWLAAWPYLAVAVAAEDWETAVGQAHIILAPEQQQLPAPLEQALQAASANPSPALFQKALTLAQQQNML